MAHLGAPGRARIALCAGHRAIRPRCARDEARADLRCRRDRRPVGDAAAGRAQRRRISACFRGLRALVGAGASLPRRAGRDPFAAARASRHQGRQHLHSHRARGVRPRVARRAALPDVRQAPADRFRVLAGVRREPAHALADRLAAGLRLPVAASLARARSRSRGRPATDRESRLAVRHVQPRRDAQALSAGRAAAVPAGACLRMDRGSIRRGEGADTADSRSA